ncbi:MAG: hypothetical protein Q9191_005509 [Dirinaria sp. TL-2023a]
MVPGTTEPRWPPRSPREALLCSPAARNRVRQHNDRTSPSPSPLKNSSTTLNLNRLPSKRSLQPTAEADEEEDEETLQLRLDAIEARLKLKKLQQKKSKAGRPTSDIENEGARNGRPGLRPELQIPVSPTRKVAAVEEKKSPGRVLLGIDKGLKGHNVSLKRPPTKGSTSDDPFRSRAVPQTSRSSTFSGGPSTSHTEQTRKTTSFSDRVSKSRRIDKEETERANRVWKNKSTGFGVNQEEIERQKSAAESKVSEAGTRASPVRSAGFSRDQVLKAIHEPNTSVPRSKSLPKISAEGQSRNQASSLRRAQQTNVPAPTQSTTKPQEPLRPQSPTSDPVSRSTSPPSDSLFEPFSTLHLSKRILPHAFLSRTLAGKSVTLIPSLLSKIKSPSYTLPPELDSDFVVIGIIASKSPPLSHKDAHKTSTTETTSTAEAAESETNARGKYMVLTLTDLKWTLDLYLFTTAYTRFWKLTPGTLIAILNPSIMPPTPGKLDTGRFSLVLDSSDDTVLEIGTSRDLGWCKSTKRDGRPCESWIDKRHTSVCEFHVDRVVERTRAGRMEVNGISGPYGPKGRRGGRTGFWGGGNNRKTTEKDGHTNGLRPEGRHYDYSSRSSYFIAPGGGGAGRSAASLLDAAAAGPFLERGGESNEERARKRLAAQEKERDIARRLGELGNGTAAEYLRQKHHHHHDNDENTDQADAKPTQSSVDVKDTSGLMAGKKSADISLSPVKKEKKNKRKAEAAAAAAGEPKREKKTRFVIGQGVREAGGGGGGGGERDIWLDAAVAGEEDELEVI